MLSTQTIQCPANLLTRAKHNAKVTTAIVNAGTPLALQSAKLATEESLIEPILVGDKSAIESAAKTIDWDISKIEQLQAGDEISSAKLSVALARDGQVKALMKGNVHTDDLLRAVLDKDQGLLSGARLSHVFHMSVPYSEQSLCITDAVINVLPDVATKVHIARNAVKLMHSLGFEKPKIALLSATEAASASMPSSLEAEQVANIASNEIQDALIEGPFAFDNAVSPKAAEIKGIDSEVAGQADVLLVPNIETGNALFKQMVYFMGAAAAGVVLGAKVPIVLTSRADPAAARLAGAALTSIYANQSS